MRPITSALTRAALAVALAAVPATPCLAGVTVAPYASIKSTKSIKANGGDKSKEDETTKERREAGLRAGLTFYRLLGVSLSAGQSKVTTTTKTETAKDEYGEIDYGKDFDLSTDDPDSTLKVTETQRVAKLTVTVDPSIGFLILRAKAGVTATQRIVEVQQDDQPATTQTFGPTYKPHSGFGLGVRFSPKLYFMAEYGFNHYAFPKLEPFEREATVSFALEI
jgi:hypothetical protein